MIDDTTDLYVQDDTPNAETHYRARFYFDPNSITMGSGEIVDFLETYYDSMTWVARLQSRYHNADCKLRMFVNEDTSNETSSWEVISDDVHYIEIDWQASSMAGTDDGRITLWIDGSRRRNLPAGALASVLHLHSLRKRIRSLPSQ